MFGEDRRGGGEKTVIELKLRTLQVELLSQFADKELILRVEFVNEGWRAELSDLLIEQIGDTANGWFRVVHRDPQYRF